jgi:hypothetical protein
MKPDDFDKQLSELYQARKQKHTLSTAQKNALLKTPVKTKPAFQSWLQASATACAIAVFAFVIFHKTDSESYTVANQIQLSDYFQVAVIDFSEQNGQTIALQNKLIEQQYFIQQYELNQLTASRNQQQKSSDGSEHLFTGKLIAKGDDWFIESCDESLLVQIKSSAIAALSEKPTLEQKLTPGDWLDLTQNAQGELIALHKGVKPKQCQST